MAREWRPKEQSPQHSRQVVRKQAEQQRRLDKEKRDSQNAVPHDVAAYVRVHKERRELTLDLQGHGLGDQQLQAVLTSELKYHLWAQLAKLNPQAPWHYITVNLSNNNLGAEGVAVLVEFLGACRRHYSTPVYVRVLKLYRNQLGDAGMLFLAQLVLTQPQPLHEIHLSHNQITGAGAAVLVFALGSLHPQSIYPFRTPQMPDRFVPCWCRLEMNAVAEPMDFVSHLQNSGKVRTITTSATTTEWGPLRAPSYCKIKGKTPQVVLHIFEKQITATQPPGGPKTKEKAGLGPVMILAQDTILELLRAENAATGAAAGVAGESKQAAVHVGTVPSGWVSQSMVEWENTATWEQAVCTPDAYEWDQSKETYDASMWSNLSTPELTAATDAYEFSAYEGSMWSNLSTPELSPASDTLPWPLPLPLESGVWATTPASPSSTLKANAAEFVPTTPEPSRNSIENACSWTPPAMRAEAVEFVPSAPAKMANFPSKDGLSPRSMLLTMSGAWGALVTRNSAVVGAIPLTPPISKHVFLRCQQAMGIVSPPTWSCGGRMSSMAKGATAAKDDMPSAPQVTPEETSSPKQDLTDSSPTTTCCDAKDSKKACVST